MAKNKNAKKTSQPMPALEPEVVEQAPAETPVVAEVEAAPTKKKYYYNAEAAKRRRERLMEYAKLGGYVPRPRSEGTGATEKRTSKTSGKTYYYTPWSKLTQEQKDARLASARDRAKEERELARKYKEEHPDEFQKEER